MKTYTPKDINEIGPVTQRAEYIKLRKIAQKRRARLEAAGFSRSAGKPFPTARSINNPLELRYQLLELSRWLREPTHRVKNAKRQRDRALNALHEDGFSFINEENFEVFTDYMDSLREEYAGQIFDSGDAADVFNQAQRIGIDPEVARSEFDFYADHLDELSRLKPVKSDKGASASAIRKKIRKLE